MFYKNGKPVRKHNKYIVVKFLENDKSVVVYVYADYQSSCQHIADDKASVYFGKVITTVQYVREIQDKWLTSLNKIYNRKCTDITVL